MEWERSYRYLAKKNRKFLTVLIFIAYSAHSEKSRRDFSDVLITQLYAFTKLISRLGTVVNLDGLGIVTKFALKIQPSYSLTLLYYRKLPFDQLKGHLNDIMAGGYSVYMFIEWAGWMMLRGYYGYTKSWRLTVSVHGIHNIANNRTR